MNIDEKAKEIVDAFKSEVDKIKADMNVEGMKAEFSKQLAELKAEMQSKTSAVAKVFVAKDVEKAVSELTAKEKVDAYARALFMADQATLKALSEGTNADGGFTVPQDFYNVLLEEIREASVMRGLVNIVPMSTNVLTLTIIDHGPDVYWTAEGAKKTTATADFSQPTITAYKLDAILYLTDELIADSAFDLTNVIIRRFADRMAEAEEQAILIGTGTGQPTGLFVANTVATRTCSGNLDFDDIIALIYDLPAKYRPRARFIIHNNNVSELRRLKDSQGRYMWQDPVAPGQPSTIQGYPVVETYWAPESQIAFGDFNRAYWLGDRQRMTVLITQQSETTFTQDKTGIRVVERIGGTVVEPNAMRKLITIP